MTRGLLIPPPAERWGRTALQAVLITLLFFFVTAAFAEVAVPQLTSRVVDQTGTLSSDAIAGLSQKLRALETRKGSQIAVLIVPTTQPESIEQFSIRVAEAWKIGRKKVDDGALLLVAKNDRRLRIEVGYGLEGVLTDVTARRIIDEDISPKFRTGDFAGGINAGIDRMIAVINSEQLPATQPRASRDAYIDAATIKLFALFVLIGAIIGGSMLGAILGRLLGSAATGGLFGIVAWVEAGSLAVAVLVAVVGFAIAMFAHIFNAFWTPTVNALWAPTGGRRSRGGWSGGSSSGGWRWSWSSGSSSSDSGSGGFSGGGGSFGGGGGSGSW
jgi:uncharacterized protein